MNFSNLCMSCHSSSVYFTYFNSFIHIEHVMYPRRHLNGAFWSSEPFHLLRVIVCWQHP